MRGWDDLPNELKLQCIMSMDLRSRRVIAACSRSCRELIKSCPVTFPRVSFGEKQDRYQILIYPGEPKKYIRLEFCKEGEKTVLYRPHDISGQTTYFCDARTIITNASTRHVVLPYPDPYELAVLTLMSLVFSPNVFVDNFEWNIELSKRNSERFMQIVGDQKMRVGHVWSHGPFERCEDDPLMERRPIFTYNGGKPMYTPITASGRVDDPVKLDVVTVIKDDTILWTKTRYHHTQQSYLSNQLPVEFNVKFLMKDANAIQLELGCYAKLVDLGYYPSTEKAIFDAVQMEATVNADGTLVKTEKLVHREHHYIMFRYSPECGLSVLVMHTDTANPDLNLMYPHCTRSPFCTAHTSPFDYWYSSICGTDRFFADIGGLLLMPEHKSYSNETVWDSEIETDESFSAGSDEEMEFESDDDDDVSSIGGHYTVAEPKSRGAGRLETLVKPIMLLSLLVAVFSYFYTVFF